MIKSRESVVVEISVSEKERKHLAEELKKIMADTYVLYVMTQNFHWNVTGFLFRSLHELFEKQYLELAGAVDLIAERIRALGFTAPGSLREFLELASLNEENHVPPPEEMIHLLLECNEILAQKTGRVSMASHEAGDAATADLLADRVLAHEKAAWMLRSCLS